MSISVTPRDLLDRVKPWVWLAMACATWTRWVWAQGVPVETGPVQDQANNIRLYLNRVAEELTHNSLADNWCHDAQASKKPILLVLRSPNEDRWASEGFVSGLSNQWNIAYLECRGIGETGWSPELQWHVRRAAAWTGRTVASMRVYDVLRCVQVLQGMTGVDQDKIVVAAQDDMCAVAAYAAFLNDSVWGVLLRNPPATQNAASRADGRGPALEMLNCLRITDLPQVTGLLCPRSVTLLGTVPETYGWARLLYKTLGAETHFQQPQELTDWHL